MPVIQVWISEQITAILGFEDDVVIELVVTLLEEKVK